MAGPPRNSAGLGIVGAGQFDRGANPIVLAVCEDAGTRQRFRAGLSRAGCNVAWVNNGEQALEFLSKTGPPDVTFLLIPSSGESVDGPAVQEVRQRFPDLPILLLSPAASPGSLVGLMRQRGRNTPGSGEQDLAGPPSDDPFFTDSNWRRRIRGLLKQVAASHAPVLLQGETGVGKEVLALYLHGQSPRAHSPFLKVNCAALPSELVESELFGYERGAFTGAFQRKPGKFELADGGTILLDEIGDMDLKLQGKLLQVLQDQTFEPLGGRDTIRVNVRVLAATHCDLEAAAREGRFREDLYYRLNVITIHVPALRDRSDEIVPLAEFLLRKHAPAGADPPALPASLRQALIAYDWPGNVRELENVVRQLWIFNEPELIERELRLKRSRKQPAAPAPGARDASVLERLDAAKERAEAEAILAALTASRWNRREAARRLDLNYKALLYRIERLGLNRDPNRTLSG